MHNCLINSYALVIVELERVELSSSQSIHKLSTCVVISRVSSKDMSDDKRVLTPASFYFARCYGDTHIKLVQKVG